MKKTICKLFFLFIIGISFQCSDETAPEVLSKEDLMNELMCRKDFNNFISSSASNQIELLKISPEIRNNISDLSNDILSDYFQDIVDNKKIEKYNSLTYQFTYDPIKYAISLNDYLSTIYYLESDFEEIVSECLYAETLKIISNNSTNNLKMLPSPSFYGSCDFMCAVSTAASGIEGEHWLAVYYGGCMVGSINAGGYTLY